MDNVDTREAQSPLPNPADSADRKESFSDSEDIDAFDAELLNKIEGTRLAVGGHKPFFMNDPQQLWLILRGYIDVYAVVMDGDRVAATGFHLMRVGPGSVLFGIPPFRSHDGAQGYIALRAVAAMGTQLYLGRLDDVKDENFDIIVVDWIDRWVNYLSRAVAPSRTPREAHLVEAEPDIDYQAGDDLKAQLDDVIWIDINRGKLLYLSDPEANISPANKPVPITERSWLHAETAAQVSGAYTPTLLVQGRLWKSLAAFHTYFFMPQAAAMIAARQLQEQEQTILKNEASRASFHDSIARISQTLLSPSLAGSVKEIHDPDSLFAAASVVADASGIKLQRPRKTSQHVDRLIEIARASHIRIRRVMLNWGWYKHDNGPLLAKYHNTPVALIPQSSRSYEIIDPNQGEAIQAREEEVVHVDNHAFQLYRPFPNLALKISQVLRFGAHGLKKDFITLGLMGLLGGALALLVPIFTGKLFSSVIPRADIPTHLSIILALTLAALGGAAFEIVKGLAVLRVQGRMDSQIQSAVWDRLLALPIPFFRRFSAGDLADRAGSINAIREILTGASLQSLMAAVFSLMSFFLLFYYSSRLALFAMIPVLLMIIITTVIAWCQMPHQRAQANLNGRIEGMVFQWLSGIAKLRVSNSEARAFARWAETYSQIQDAKLKIARLGALQQTINAIFPVTASILLFTVVVLKINAPDSEDPPLGIGEFLAFNAAFGQFATATTNLTALFTTLMRIVPLYERANPILKAVPEVVEGMSDPGDISGDIEFSHITFRYIENAPPVLNDINFHIEAGEYVAFVGSSGCGKSTILRLLLGFEAPESGGIYFDGLDMSSLDIAALRRCIGVVLQNGKITSGSIFTNIVGSTTLTLDDAWAAARAAGLNEDIESMPMGMHTVLSEGAGTLSGGQRQRLMIARALATRPRLLLLDEATSALDNRTQEIVNHSLSQLNLTRIVVAHRLSTIVNCDRIFVIKAGCIVETGSYQELLAYNGEFAALAKRQII